MEVCAFGSGFIHVLIPPSPIAYPPSYPTRLKNSLLISATTALSESRAEPSNVSTASHNFHPISYARRQAIVIEIQQSSDLDSALSRSGRMLKVQDLNALLRHYGKLDRWQDLSQLFEWMERHGKISIASYSSYIKLMGKSINPAKALEIYNSIEDKSIRNNVIVCNSVLGCLIKNNKFESGIKLFNQMKRSGIRPDAVTYSTLLAGCMKVEHGYSKALELVQELEYNGLRMDSVIYGTLLAVCASNNRSKEAECYFQQMKDEGHTPNVFHYSSLLNAYSTDGNYRKAEALIEEMKSEGLVPNKVILTTLLKVYVRGGLFEKSRKLLTELETLGYAEEEMPYCLLMDGLSKAGHVHEAKSIFYEMKQKHVKSDGYSHCIMISAFCRGKLFEEAKQLAEEFETMYYKYDVVTLNTMLCAFCRAGEMECVMRTLRKMDELAITPDRKTFHILAKYFCKEKLYLLAYQTLADMHSKGHQLEEELCSSLIFHLGKSGSHSEAFSVYNMLRYSKRTMCKALHEKILHILIAGRLLKDAYVVVKDNAGLISLAAIKKFVTAFVKFGNINLINDVIKAVHSSGYKIDQKPFQMATTRYIAHPEKKELLLQLLQWMPGQGYLVDSSTRNLILKNSHLFGRQLVAEVLSKQHKISKALRSHQMKGQ
ncbi:pentatricopeptide repeat-containing protein At1g10910, chloroplastic [Malania oleifera]|uniref:pentatricopeptide repeat-containing protein At1g10910, chloroplastic n=1 Tax=Malania oleifera TaxID=397392 RepID=UPI0025AE2DEA|nr:pentatricopeptide repeat-containing protein At1g10910, chloroplastic [Malania oleifera]